MSFETELRKVLKSPKNLSSTYHLQVKTKQQLKLIKIEIKNVNHLNCWKKKKSEFSIYI